MISQVFETLKSESRKGDFFHLTNGDRSDIDIDLNNESITSFSKGTWKLFVDKKIKKTQLFCTLLKKTLERKTLKI